ncbi:hypothetical protein BDF14DRAFT_1726742 [Spinellus fusiger]|nr:hypothetical protein BDF14DRAFT_1726742 [Spinellus fusiger]
MSTPKHLAEQLHDMRNEQDIQRMLQHQEECIVIYQNTQRNLGAFNEFSRVRYQDVHKHFESHTKLLKEIKKDLDSVYAKLGYIKRCLGQKYPEETKFILEKYPPPVLEDE